MPRRSSFHRALMLGAALGAVSATDLRGQTVAGFRSGFDGGGFPNSPSDTSAPSPEDNSPPAVADPAASAGAGAASAPTAQTSPLDLDTSGSGQEAVEPGAPNYGKLPPKKRKLYRPDPKVSPPLPALVPYRGAPGPQRRVLNPTPPPRDAVDPPQPGPSFAVIQSPQRPKRAIPDPDPFAPIGVRVGELRLLPFVETSTGYETNPNQISGAGVRPSAVLRVDGGLDVNSDFSRSNVAATLRGG